MYPEYCCFYFHQNLRVGWVRRQDGSRMEVVLEDGEAVSQRPGNMLFRWRGTECGDDPGEALNQMRRNTAGLGLAPDVLAGIYGRLEPGRPTPMGEITILAGPGTEQGGREKEPAADGKPGGKVFGWEDAALFLSLLEDNLRFRYSRKGFIPRSPEEIEERSRREEETLARERWITRARTWKEELDRGEWDMSHSGDPDAEAFLEQVKSILALEKQSPYWNLLAKPLELFSLHSLDLNERLHHWLELAGAWPGWPEIWLIWGRIESAFTPELNGLAGELALAVPAAQGRRDFRGHMTYTIDSPGTRDCDDGVSILEKNGDSLLLGLHIAEPSALVQRDSPLFAEAAVRMASMYSLAGIYPMFPVVLSNGRFSLNAGEDREALTFVVRLDRAGARLEGIERSMVRVTRNLDYALGQKLLEEEQEEWGLLATLCSHLSESREKRGATISERRDLWVDISRPEHITVEEVYRSGPVNRLVEELAILYNSLAGDYCRRHNLPAIYRTQPRFRKGAEDWYGKNQQTMAARFNTQGMEHYGLGCDRYILATSPIRRFVDLVMQGQIAGHVSRGRVSFEDMELLGEWAEQADGRLAVHNQVSRRIEQYYLRRYLAQNIGLEVRALVRTRRESLLEQVVLEPFGLKAECHLSSGAAEGDLIRVRVDQSDPEREIIRVTPVG
ncbi:MAG: RNB domain-containing ribonuclease [Deltaproteobacteria bacterium]|nr:RNB domain-containing ribonuclease [Deltaproteobacteria bacterium]